MRATQKGMKSLSNIKMPGLKKDSNPHRQKKNEEEMQEFIQELPETDLYKVPDHLFLRDKKLYEYFVSKLKEAGVVHLIDIDISSIASTVNTLSLLNESEQAILQDGIQQEIVTREGHTKNVPNPMIATRNTLSNTFERQLKSLMLDPSTRQQLLQSLSETGYINDDDDDEIIKQILGGTE